MTICRSEFALLAAALMPLAARAQQPPAIQRPIQQAQQAQQSKAQPAQPAPRPAATPSVPGAPSSVTLTGGSFPQQATQSAPATHTVARGETLWGLAQQYLGDPLLWPELYRLNTDVVEDPHWIFPGEELKLTEQEDTTAVAADTTRASQSYLVTPTDTSAAPAEPTPTVVGNPAVGPTIFSTPPSSRPRAQEAAIQRLAAASYRAVRDGEYYSAGFLTENQVLSSGRVLPTPSSGRSPGYRTAVQLYDDVLVMPAPGDTLQTGGLLLSYKLGDEVGDYGRIVIPTALMRVKRAEEADHYLVSVVRIFQPVYEDQEVLNIQPFSLNTSQRATPVADGVTGTVIRIRDPHELAQRQQVLFIDKGANNGVRPGDLLSFYTIRRDELHGGQTEQDLGRGIVVNTRSATSTVIIVELYSGDIGTGTLIRQIGRMPS